MLAYACACKLVWKYAFWMHNASVHKTGIGIGRYTKRRGVADGVSGTTITWIDIAIDSTFL